MQVYVFPDVERPAKVEVMARADVLRRPEEIVTTMLSLVAQKRATLQCRLLLVDFRRRLETSPGIDLSCIIRWREKAIRQYRGPHRLASRIGRVDPEQILPNYCVVPYQS